MSYNPVRIEPVKPGRFCEVGRVVPRMAESNCKVQQSQKKNADINQLMKKFERTGVPPRVTSKKPLFGDFTGFGNYHEMLIKVKDIGKAFQDLPYTFRKRVGNDPQKALDFVSDPKNALEAVNLGLLSKDIVPKLAVDPSNADQRIYVDKDGNQVEPLHGMKTIVEINAEIANNKAKS